MATLGPQLDRLDKGIPGGLKGYIERSKKLLEETKREVNPLESFTVVSPFVASRFKLSSINCRMNV